MHKSKQSASSAFDDSLRNREHVDMSRISATYALRCTRRISIGSSFHQNMCQDCTAFASASARLRWAVVDGDHREIAHKEGVPRLGDENHDRQHRTFQNALGRTERKEEDSDDGYSRVEKTASQNIWINQVLREIRIKPRESEELPWVPCTAVGFATRNKSLRPALRRRESQ